MENGEYWILLTYLITWAWRWVWVCDCDGYTLYLRATFIINATTASAPCGRYQIILVDDRGAYVHCGA